ncbi:hypothetical protein N7491_002995 [Penicillium cf. griseofulvum]|uniref:Uncharacterized protein n=1 Tax=Penicillium cf. griseofulvum TaxID=2972120 RepID=A0A9W9MRW2_9EURO|nr:hypothetical protein N7472_002834 [Penicillium cf. griseofulvum]KAJ5440589.1 hypothetical protein N7491_002995 [Penicillium cf. griseofulvum]KAJ5448638.1 hypothetical protein N7445_003459 [Penicillium cf. griseofulvum]
MFRPPSKEKPETCTSATSDIPAQHDTSIEPRPKSPPIALFDPSIQENYEFDYNTTSDILAHYDISLTNTPRNTLHSSTSTEEDPGAISGSFFDDFSDESSSGGSGSSGSPSSASSGASSTASFDTKPEAPPMPLFGKSAQESCELKASTASDSSDQYDSDSDVQAVILRDNTCENDPDTLNASTSSQEEPSTISKTLSDDFPDDFSWGDSNCSYDARSTSSSIDCFDTSSHHDSEPEDDETPRGSQTMAASMRSL